MRCDRLLAVLALSTLVVLGPAADDEIHLCEGPNGEVVLQDDPCGTTPSRRPAPVSSPRPAPGSAPRVQGPPAFVLQPPPQPPATPPAVLRHDGPLGSPERTWRTLVEALRRGDAARAGDCFAPSTLDSLAPDASSLERLRAVVDGFTRVEPDYAYGSVAVLRAGRAARAPKWILLERDERGDWRITAF